jgi:DNA-binding beta-propeller fold protein YncE
VKEVNDAKDWGVARSWFGRMIDTLTGRHETPFVRPTGVAHRDGVLYVADPGAQAVFLYDEPRHRNITLNRVGDRVLASPVAVAAGTDGQFFIVDSWLREVLLLDRDGRLVRTIGHPDLQRPSSVAFDPERHRLYVGDSKAHVVHVFDDQGARVAHIGRLGGGPGEFNSPTHIAVTGDGSLIVTDALNFRVQVFDAHGNYRYRVGEHGDGAGNFAAPKGVATDRAGRIYVADAMFDAVQIFDSQGRLLLGVGEQGRGPGQFWIPNGLSIDSSDQLFVADAYNRRVQVFQLLGPNSDAVEVARGSPR